MPPGPYPLTANRALAGKPRPAVGSPRSLAALAMDFTARSGASCGPGRTEMSATCAPRRRPAAIYELCPPRFRHLRGACLFRKRSSGKTRTWAMTSMLHDPPGGGGTLAPGAPPPPPPLAPWPAGAVAPASGRRTSRSPAAGRASGAGGCAARWACGCGGGGGGGEEDGALMGRVSTAADSG